MAPRRVEGSILTVLMAAVFALSLVPAGAWASAIYDGVSPTDKGTITVSNPQANETYNAYKILDLASFQDTDVATGQHATDAYSYVIKATDLSDPTKANPWLAFINAAKDVNNNPLFTVDDDNPVKLALNGEAADADYYVVTPTVAFKNAFVNEPSTTSKDETTNDQFKSTSLVQKFAQDALYYATTTCSPALSPDAWATSADGAANLQLTNDGNAADASTHNGDLPLGYWLVDSTGGALCALDTTNKDVTVYEKNDKPSVDKKVQEDRSITAETQNGDLVNYYQEVDDATVGDKVYYRTDINIKKGAQGYVLHDQMEAGLTYDPNSLNVWYVPNSANRSDANKAGWLNLTTPSGAFVLGSSSAYKQNPAKADFYDDTTVSPDTFTVAFTSAFLTYLSDNIGNSMAPDQDISDTSAFVVEYAATLNPQAEVKSANTNETWLAYGDVTSGEDVTTPHQFTDTYTWPIQVYKYTIETGGNLSDSSAGTPLPGAEFELYELQDYTCPTLNPRTVDGKFRFVEMVSTDPGWNESALATTKQYMVVKPANASDTTIQIAQNDERTILDHVTTPTDGKVYIAGLDEGTYFLHEKTAPKGYNKLAHDVKVTVASGAIISDLNAHSEDNTAAVPTETVQYANWDSAASTPDWQATPSSVSANTQDSIPVLNNTGGELPSTGGIGTTIFYVAGTVLVVGAAVMLVAKRRMGAEA